MSQLRFNKSTLARVLGTFALAVLALGPGWRVVAQAPALLFGVNSGVAKPIAVDSSGNLKITVASGSPAFTSFGVGGTSLTGANVGVTAVKQITELRTIPPPRC